MNPGGSLVSNLDDVARLMLLHRNRGMVGNRQIIGAANDCVKLHVKAGQINANTLSDATLHSRVMILASSIMIKITIKITNRTIAFMETDTQCGNSWGQLFYNVCNKVRASAVG